MAYLGQAAVKEREYEYGKTAQTGLTALPEIEGGRRPQAKKAPYFKYFVMAAGVFATLICILTSYSTVTELTVKSDNMRTELAQLESDANALNAKKEERFNLTYVEQVATQQLGMVKMDKDRVTYVATSNPEKITVAAEEQNVSELVASIVKSFNAVVEYLN